ncbi:SCARB2, partial [Cordylochernes scorpioides]
MRAASVFGAIVEKPSQTVVMLSLSQRSLKLWTVILASLGIVLFLGGAIMLNIFPGILQNKIKEKLILHDGTPTYDKWVESPVPILLKIYFFNVTNPEGIKARQKPILKEIGPFVYREMRKKDVVAWDKENGTVHYINEKYFYFERDLSYADEDMNITIVNIPLLYLARILDDATFFFRTVGTTVINKYGMKLFVTHSVRDLLFDGYPIELIIDAVSMGKSFVPNMPEIKTRFGFLYDKNGTREEFYSVYTGEKGVQNYTSIHTYLNQTSLDFWHNPYCNMLNGTDGRQFPFPLDKNEKVYVFSPELCRYEQDVDVEGITAYRYTARAELFARTPENQGFCTDPKKCPRSGIHQVARCKKREPCINEKMLCGPEAPIVISAPHFYDADEYYVSQFEGLNPNKEDHETRLDIEPQTGTTVQAKRRIMISVESEPRYGIFAMQALSSDDCVPQSARIPPHLAKAFLDKVKKPAMIFSSVFIAAIALGVLMLLIAAWLLVLLL